MNKNDRENIRSIVEELDDLKDRLQEYADTEQAKFDNLSEGLQMTEHGQSYSEAADTLSSAVGYIEDAINSLDSF